MHHRFHTCQVRSLGKPAERLICLMKILFNENLVCAGVPASLSSFKPATSDEVIPWDFLSRLEYSLTDSNPRRRIHSDIKEGLEDITREVMASINSCSRQRGRVVEERSALYGYRRVNSYGADTILDLLLVYRKYRGRKVTLPVRRHVYLHQHFTGTNVDACAFLSSSPILSFVCGNSFFI